MLVRVLCVQRGLFASLLDGEALSGVSAARQQQQRAHLEVEALRAERRVTREQHGHVLRQGHEAGRRLEALQQERSEQPPAVRRAALPRTSQLIVVASALVQLRTGGAHLRAAPEAAVDAGQGRGAARGAAKCGERRRRVEQEQRAANADLDDLAPGAHRRASHGGGHCAGTQHALPQHHLHTLSSSLLATSRCPHLCPLLCAARCVPDSGTRNRPLRPPSVPQRKTSVTESPPVRAFQRRSRARRERLRHSERGTRSASAQWTSWLKQGAPAFGRRGRSRARASPRVPRERQRPKRSEPQHVLVRSPRERVQRVRTPSRRRTRRVDGPCSLSTAETRRWTRSSRQRTRRRQRSALRSPLALRARVGEQRSARRWKSERSRESLLDVAGRSSPPL